MKERIRNILKYMLEGDQSWPLERRLLLTAVVIGMLTSLVGVIVSLIINSTVPVLILAVAMFLLLTIIYHLVRFRNIYRPLIVPLIILSFAAFAVLWIFDGGINGSALFLGYLVLILSLIIVSERKKIFVVSAFIVLTISVYLLQLFYPELIRGFDSESERWTDNLITVIYSAFFIFLIIRFLHRNYSTEREKAEKSEARIRSIMENSADAIFITDREGRYLYSNLAASDLLGYSREELQRRTIADLAPPDKLDEHLKLFRDILNKGRGFAELELRKKDGEHISTDLNAVVLPDGRIYGSCRDISVRKRALEAIKDNEEKLRRLNADKNLFISILSHDLKGPFQNLMGLSEILMQDLRTMDTDEVENIISLLESTSKKAYKLFEDLLKWAHSQQGRIPFKPVQSGLKDIFDDVAGLLKTAAERKNIIMKYEAPSGISIYADRDMVHTVLRNLLSNAIKFTGDGGEVRVRAERTDKGTAVSVIDNGVGIKPDDMEKLFDIASIYTTEGTAEEKGTGLGLLLCKEFIEKHGGTIEVESTAGEGSEFRFFLPGPGDSEG